MQKSKFFTQNLLTYNKQLAIVLGLKEAMVLTEIINQKTINKFYVNLGYISEEVLTFIDHSTLKRLVNKLESLGLLRKVDTNREMIIEELRKKPSVKGVGNKVCTLCNSTTAQLHFHHYPLKASEGGTETIGICPNCHFEFHYMEYNYEINLEKINELLEKGVKNNG